MLSRRTSVQAAAVAAAWVAAGLVVAPGIVNGTEPTDDERHFIARVEPVLRRRCYACHSHDAKPLEGGLVLDSRGGWMRGGDSGAAIVPGKPDDSRLIQAVRRSSPDLQMPPETRLPDDEIALLADWVRRGAADPRSAAGAPSADWAAQLAERRQWWSFQPVRRGPVPEVGARGSSRDLVDRFIVARLESEDLAPAPAANRPAVARRLAYVLTGLPPDADDLADFAADSAPDAYQRLVDRWLASPRFGEHWARHWMDLVRYSDTHGSEHDPLIPHAWRYRDYLVRAFNGDVPFDRLLSEQVAGDLLSPRRDLATGCDESLVGPAAYRFVEFYPTPVDVKNEEISVLDTQIDTLTKTFLGLTLSCARCHDHKFDPLSARDYQAFYGILASTRTAIRHVDDPTPRRARARALAELKPQLRRELTSLWRAQLETWPAALARTAERLAGTEASKETPREEAQPDGQHVEVARWVAALTAARDKPTDPLRRLAQLAAGQPVGPIGPPAWDRFRLFADFGAEGAAGAGAWFASDDFPGLAAPGDFAVSPAGKDLLAAIYPRGRYSHLLTNKQGGSLRSPNFTLDMKYVSVLAAGVNAGRVRLVIENFQSDQLLFAQAMPSVSEPRPRWITLPIREVWQGRRAYLDAHPRDDMPYPGKMPDARKLVTDGRSGIGIRAVVFHDAMPPPEPESPWPASLRGPLATWRDAAERLESAARQALDAWGDGRCSDQQALLLDTLLRAGLLVNQSSAGQALESLVDRYRKIEAEYPAPVRVSSVVDDVGFDERFFPRGNYRRAGDAVARRVPEVLGGASCSPTPLPRLSPPAEFQDSVAWNRTLGSGRRSLVESLVDPANPLTSRVAVNRLWHQVMGAGLVRTVDNFGRLGESPSHPELLDRLASDFVAGGWQVKALIRQLVSSATFRQATAESAAARDRDPDNRLWSHATVRRLTAESLRDSLLAASGRLDRAMGGPGVPLPVRVAYKDFETPLSGPDDGNGRRSLYLEARRNYPQPLLAAFDQPKPVLTVGRRNVTNVPAQSLALLNDPFVVEQTRQMAQQTAAVRPADARIRVLYERAFSRRPADHEVQRCVAFLEEQATSLGTPTAAWQTDERVWAELAHALINMQEFLYLP